MDEATVAILKARGIVPKHKERYWEKQQLANGVNALLEAKTKLEELEKEQNPKKKELFDNEPINIALQISAVKMPGIPVEQTLKFKVKHSILKENSEVCLFVKDLEKGLFIDHEKTKSHFQDLLIKNNISGIHKVIPLRQLKVDYKAYEARRHLSQQYDMFLADKRIFAFLPKFLGKAFYGHKKIPIQVDLTKKKLKEEIDSALHTVLLPLAHKGPCSALTVGHTGMDKHQINTNVYKIFTHIGKKYPGGWKNIRSIYIKAQSNSMSIPLFLSLVSSNEVRRPVIKTNLITEPVEDELPIRDDNTKVRVFPDGTITVFNPRADKRKKLKLKKLLAAEEKEVVTPKKRKLSDDEDSDDEVLAAEDSYIAQWEHTRDMMDTKQDKKEIDVSDQE